MNAWVAGQFLYPLREKLAGRDSFARLEELRKAAKYSLPELRAYQLEKLRKLVRHCREQVPYYRELFKKSGIEPDDIRDLRDLERVPFLTKPVIRQNLEDLKAQNYGRRLLPRATSGSSGEPLFFYADPGRIAWDVAAIWRTLGEWGIGIADRRVVMRGPLRYRPWTRGWADLFINTRLFPASQMTRDRMARYAATLKRYRPKYLFGYPSAIYRFCRFLEDEGIEMRESGITIALAISEMLYDFQRAIIEKTLGCRMIDFYSARDAGVMGIECPQGKRHALENMVIETIEKERPGRRGEIVVTHLGSYGMPFLRYKTGDLGVLSEEECACGRKAPVLQEIDGRAGDFILTPEGGAVHSMAVLQALSLMPGMQRIERFRLIQGLRGCLQVQMVVAPAWRTDLEQKTRISLSPLLGKGMEIRVDFVDEIEPDPSGRLRVFESTLSKGDGVSGPERE